MNNPQHYFSRMRQAAEEFAATLEPPEVQDDFPQTQQWRDALLEVDAQVEKREMFTDTVLVVVAGPSGAGKSCLVNALTRDNSVEAGGARPTTREISTFAGKPEELTGFKDFLGLSEIFPVGGANPASFPSHLVVSEIPDWHLAANSSSAQPDESKKLLDMADVVIWAVDPQKYADDVFLSDLNRWNGPRNSFVVVTHIDMLSVSQLDEVKADFHKLSQNRGLHVDVLSTSIYQESSLSEFREAILRACKIPDVIYCGLQNQVQSVATKICKDAGLNTPVELPDNNSEPERKFCDTVAKACGAEMIEQQLRKKYLKESRPLVLLPPIAWLTGMKSENQDKQDKIVTFSSINAIELRSAAEKYTSKIAQSCPSVWKSFLQLRSKRHVDSLGTALCLAMSSWEAPKVKRQFWWRVWWFCQWVFFLVTLASLVWVLVWLVCLLGNHTLPGILGWVPLAPLVFVGALIVTKAWYWIGLKLTRRRSVKFGENGVLKFRQLTDEVSKVAFMEPMQQALSLHPQLRELGEQMGGI